MPEEPKPPVAIRVTRPQGTEDEFLDQELETLTRTSVTLLGVQPRPQGVVLRFEIVLASGTVMLRGEGRVVGFKPNALHGLGGLTLRFTRLDSKSKALVDKAAALRDKRRPSLTPPKSVPPADPAAPIPAARPSTPSPARASTPPPASRPPPPVAARIEVDINVDELGLPPKSVPPPRSSRPPASRPSAIPPPLPLQVSPAAPAVAPAPHAPPPPSVSPPPPPAVKTPPASPSHPASTSRPADRDALLERLRTRAKRLEPSDVERILTKQRQA